MKCARRNAKKQTARTLKLEWLDKRNLLAVGASSFASETELGNGFDGVVRIRADNGNFCTGSLLESRRHVLSAAHCFDAGPTVGGVQYPGNGEVDGNAIVDFLVGGSEDMEFVSIGVDSQKISLHPLWEGDGKLGYDLAILELPVVAPGSADGYAIYDGDNELGIGSYHLVGFGATGDGITGEADDNQFFSVRRYGTNTWDAYTDVLASSSANLQRLPPPGTALLSDFDSGLPSHDTIGRFFTASEAAIPNDDSLVASGDSGGPAFLGAPGNFQIAGVASWVLGGFESDRNLALNSSFGDLSAHTRVSAFRDDWIRPQVSQPYQLVLDLAVQHSGDDGDDDNLVIRITDEALQIVLNDNSEPIFSEPNPSQIQSIRIKGSADHEIAFADPQIPIQITYEDIEVVTDYSPFLDAVVSGQLAGDEPKVYPVSGIAGQAMSVSTYFGYTRSNRWPSLGVNRSGRLRIVDANGVELIAPANQETPFIIGTQSSARTHYHVSASVDDFVLPSTGTYYVEVSGGIGEYWIGITNPKPGVNAISTLENTSGTYTVQGDTQAFDFFATQGDVYAWAYEGHSIEPWQIRDQHSDVVASGDGGSASIITFVPGESGFYSLHLSDERRAVQSVADIGPFSFQLNAVQIDRLDENLSESLDSANEADLYAVHGEAGQLLSASAYFGITGSPVRSAVGLNSSGTIKLFGSDGQELFTADHQEVFAFRSGTGGRYAHNHISSQIDDFLLPESGTYFVQVSGGVGGYSLAIADPRASQKTLENGVDHQSMFEVLGDRQELVFDASEGETFARRYVGPEIEPWEIVADNGAVVATGQGGTSAAIVFTPEIPGRYELRLKNAGRSISSASHLGPFSYELQTTETQVLNQVHGSSLTSSRPVHLYPLSGTGGESISVHTFFGSHNTITNTRSPLYGTGAVRVLDDSGQPVAQASNAIAPHVFTNYHSASLRGFILPYDGNYFVEISSTSGQVGGYSLGIAKQDGLLFDINASNTVNGTFGVLGHKVEFGIEIDADEPIGWSYQSARELDGWKFFGPDGQLVSESAGGEGSDVAIKISSPLSGLHRFVLDGVEDVAIRSAGSIGPTPFTLTPLDATPPVSSIVSATLSESDPVISLNLSLADPTGVNGAAASGVAATDIFVARDDGAFALWRTIHGEDTEVTYPAESNHVYWFYSESRDNAGNSEVKPIRSEVVVSVGDFSSPTSAVVIESVSGSGLIELSVDGMDFGGGVLTRFELFVSVDGENYVRFAETVASVDTPQSGGAAYQAILDGSEHRYDFVAIGQDDSGNMEAFPLDPDATLTRTFRSSSLLEPTGIEVAGGAKQRSYIQSVDILFSEQAGLGELITEGAVRIERFEIDDTDLTAGTGSNVAIESHELLDQKIRFNFGFGGAGGSSNSNVGDGVFVVSIDTDRNGQFDDGHSFSFHRLLGDLNGDGRVDFADRMGVFREFGRRGPTLNGDLNGDGVVNILDVMLTQRNYGRSVDAALSGLLDD